MLAIADRILVMRQGRVVGETRREEASEELLMQMMTPRPCRMRRALAAPAQAPDVLKLLGRFAPVIFLVLMLIFALLEPRFCTRSICST